MIDTVLFDLDGTLLPMDQSAFVREYVGLLARKLAPFGVDGGELFGALMAGMLEMVRNDGSQPNQAKFWDCFSRRLGRGASEIERMTGRFYEDEFDQVQRILGDRSGRAEMIRGLREKSYTIVLATNPVFPAAAVHTRMSWIGLTPSDFDWVTTYEDAHYCKPNLGYYREILGRIGKAPAQCLMAGNNIQEDMCARDLGMEVFLMTDYLENPDNGRVEDYPNGGFARMRDRIDRLPPLRTQIYRDTI